MPVASSPVAKNISLFHLVETAIEPICPALIRRGVTRRHERGARDAMDAFSAQDGRTARRTAKSCGSGAPTLVPSWRGCFRIAPMTGARKPGPREEHEGNRKTLARGMPDRFGLPVVTMLVCFHFSHARLWVRPAPGIPCALRFSRAMFDRTRADRAAGMRSRAFHAV